MNVFLLFVAPTLLILGVLAVLSYKFLRRPSPLPLGNIFPKLCAIIWDEIHNYCERVEQANTARNHLQREIRANHASITRRYIGGMTLNTRLFQQVLRFERKKIDPNKSSLQYETWETLTLRMLDEASMVRWMLAKAQAGLALRSWIGLRLSREGMDKILREYKQLEQDFVALVRIASDEVYYNMLVERLGLSNWRLIDGGSPGTPVS